MTPQEVIRLIREKKVEFVDLHIVDMPGMWQHVTLPVSEFEESSFIEGVPFDGSSLRGFRGIEESDMLMLPDPTTAVLDPFMETPTLNLICDITDPDGVPYNRDPRQIARRAEAYLKETGIADTSFWGPELEFFIFDRAQFHVDGHHSFYSVDSQEAHWNSGTEQNNHGYPIRTKQGYFPVAPIDSLVDVRTEMVKTLQKCGIRVEMHHHEVASAGQSEIDLRFNTLTKMADIVMQYKYILRNVAVRNGKTVTFMPKPIFGDNGSGMHVHQSLWKEKNALFYDPDGYGHLSKLGLAYIGGVLTHAPALLALTNPSTNSYRRLVPGYEAPVNIVFSRGNRSAAIRIPITKTAPATRIEFRTPDPSSNPYLAFSACLMAGLDGIRRQIDPMKAGFGPMDKNIYALSDAEKEGIASVPGSLKESLDALEADHEFLLQGNVFTEDFLRTWIDYKRRNEVDPINLHPHPKEFELYYDC